MAVIVEQEDAVGINGTKFKSIMLVSIYRWAKVGLKEVDMIAALKVTKKTWQSWKKKFPSIKMAMRMGLTDSNDGGNWHKYVYDRLSVELQELWDQINNLDEQPNGLAMIESILADHGKTVRQQLYLHALVYTNFSPTRAMRKVCIDKTLLQEWIEKDPKFGELVEEIQWHKDNFFEEKLIQLVGSGSEAATLHVARSRLRSRGYGLKSEVDVKHSGTIEHQHIDLAELDLPFEVRKVILESIRKRDEQIALERARSMRPVEVRALSDLSEEIASAPE